MATTRHGFMFAMLLCYFSFVSGSSHGKSEYSIQGKLDSLRAQVIEMNHMIADLDAKMTKMEQSNIHIL